jgi:putative transposase
LQYACIAAHQQTWPVAVLCDVLGGGRRGFSDDHRRQAVSSLSGEDLDFLERIPAIAQKTHHSYGSRRMSQQLQEEGDAVGRWRARRLMTQAGVSVAGRRRRGPKTPDSRHGYGVAPNLLDRTCDVMAPNVAWCGEVTDIWTEEGWWYTSVRVDRYASTGGGWAMREPLETPWVRNALAMALGLRQPDAGLIPQSARGSPYASHAYRGMLSAHGLAGSMSGKGEC